jgi:hypothetical protein
MTNRFLAITSLVFFLAAAAPAQTSRPAQWDPRTGDPRRPRIYDVRDLIADAPLPRDFEAGPKPPASQHPLIRAIRAFMPPPLPADDRELSMVGNGQVLACVLMEQHEWLNRFLDGYRTRIRDAKDDVFRVETQCFEASVEQAASIGIKDGAPAHVADDAALAVLRKEIAGMKGAFVGPLETTEVVMGRPGHDETFSELTYVKEYAKHANVEPGNQTLTLPVLATEKEGIFVDVLVVAMPEDRFGCLLEARTSRIEKPVASRGTPDGAVAVPVVTTTSIEAKATFDGKMTILFPGPPRNGRVPFVTVKVWRKRPDAEAK